MHCYCQETYQTRWIFLPTNIIARIFLAVKS
jgi:hypothetical protein